MSGLFKQGVLILSMLQVNLYLKWKESSWVEEVESFWELFFFKFQSPDYKENVNAFCHFGKYLQTLNIGRVS